MNIIKIRDSPFFSLHRGKGKFGYLDWSIPQPSADNSAYSTWEINKSLVMSWLIHSMESKIGEIYVLYPTAKSKWDVVSHSYSDLEDSSQNFALHNRVRNLGQEDASVTDYFHSLTRLWQELDLFQHHNWHDPKDSKIYRDTNLKEHTYDFLASLNPSLDEVRGRILGLKLLLVINEIFTEARREEHHKSIMLGSNSNKPLKSTAMAAKSFDDRSKKPATWCKYCHKPYHTKSKCWKLHGKPAD